MSAFPRPRRPLCSVEASFPARMRLACEPPWFRQRPPPDINALEEPFDSARQGRWGGS